MRTTRRTLLSLSGAATIAALAGCGRDSGGGTSQSSASPIASGAATGALIMWAMGTEGELLPKLVKEFESANAGVKVNVTALPWDSAYDKFNSAIAAGTTPDLAMVGTTWMPGFAAAGALDPTPPVFDKSKFFEGAYGTTEVDGAAYGVPWYVETRVVYYRTDLLEKTGLMAPAADWDALMAMAKAYQDKAGAKFGIGLQPGGTGSWQTVMPLAWSNGGAIISDDMSKFTFDDPKNVEALAYYQSFFTEGVANKMTTQTPTEAAFVDGSVPMFISGPWMRGVVETASGKPDFKDKYNVMVMPKKEQSASFVGGSNLGVFTSSKNRDSAWKLVQFLTEPATQVDWFKASTDLPSVQAAWDDPALSSDAKLAVFGEQLKTAYAPPSIATWEEVATKLDNAIEEVCVSGLDPETALKRVQQEATSIGMG